jgi:hypothetical protein
MAHQESSLSKSIYQNMQLKDSDELQEIWIKNDRLEWSNEAFSIVHDILLERLGSVPEQNTDVPQRKRNRKSKEKAKIPTSLIAIFSPAFVVLLLVLLIPVINPKPEDKWFSILMFVSMALFFFLPGFYIGWKSLTESEKTKIRIAKNLPNMKKRMGIFYHFYTYFLPDRFVPSYFLYLGRFTSIVLIYGGIRMMMFLIDVLQL